MGEGNGRKKRVHRKVEKRDCGAGMEAGKRKINENVRRVQEGNEEKKGTW